MIKVYEEYIDSGIDWVGLVPSNWRQTQLKYISSISKGKKAKEDFQDFQEGMVPYLSMEYLRSQTDSPSFVYAHDPNIVLVDVQDLLILWDGSKAGEIVKAKKGALSSTMGKIHVESELFDLNYLTYYLKNAESYIQANTVGMGIPHVSGEVLRTLYITFPDKEIQTKIAQYLDHQTSIIDQLIHTKEKLIELLKEKRQAVINEAVTKGLNPDAKMKDSGIEWLGEVPESFKIIKIKSLLMSGRLLQQDGNHGELHPTADDYSDEGIPFIMANNVNQGKVDLINCKFLPQSVTDKLRIGFSHSGDVLLTHKGTVGRVAIVPEIHAPYIMLTPQVTYYRVLDHGISNNYLALVFQSDFFQTQLKVVGSEGSTRSYVGLLNQKDLKIILPDIKAQNEVVTLINKLIEQIDSTSNKIIEQIDKLKEYRKSIISEAITGKIDVRDWQPNNIQVA